jgi:hypothetical protein
MSAITVHLCRNTVRKYSGLVCSCCRNYKTDFVINEEDFEFFRERTRFSKKKEVSVREKVHAWWSRKSAEFYAENSQQIPSLGQYPRFRNFVRTEDGTLYEFEWCSVNANFTTGWDDSIYLGYGETYIDAEITADEAEAALTRSHAKFIEEMKKRGVEVTMEELRPKLFNILKKFFEKNKDYLFPIKIKK